MRKWIKNEKFERPDILDAIDLVQVRYKCGATEVMCAEDVKWGKIVNRELYGA